MLGPILALVLAASNPAAPTIGLAVPVVRQAPERCGPAALQMVLEFYGADSSAVRANAAYDPVLHGSLITDLAAAARRAGFAAEVRALDRDALVHLLQEGVPPILLYQSGRGPLTKSHYAVVVGWDEGRARFRLHDGRSSPSWMNASTLLSRWGSAGRQALIVRRPA